MNKRIKRKKRFGEFKEWCAPIAIKLKAETDVEQFLNEFVKDAIIPNACGIGGGMDQEIFEGFLELGRATDNPEEKLGKIISWLQERAEVEKAVAGKLADAWYGAVEEIEI